MKLDKAIEEVKHFADNPSMNPGDLAIAILALSVVVLGMRAQQENAQPESACAKIRA